jgi:Zn-dependent protease
VNIRPVRQSVRPSPVFLAICGLTALGGVLAWLAETSTTWMAYVGVFTFVIAGWVVSICLHEFAHAYLAWRYGDHDVAVRGYLTLNPLRYSSPVLSIVLPLVFLALGGIGLPGGAVYVRTSFMTPWRRTTVAVAGAVVNAACAVILLVLAALLADYDHKAFWGGVAFLGFLQVTAVVLNLLPIPGLDGYGALEPHLSPQTQRSLEPAKQFGFFILLIVLIAPPLNHAFFSIVYRLFDLSGVNAFFLVQGSELTRFWSAWT